MRVLVTGGAGFIGSSVVHVLLGAGHEVGVIDDLSTGRAENLHPAAWFRMLDILDASLEALVGEFGPDAVVHLAAQASVPASIKDPERDWAVNAEGTRLVASAAAKAGAQRVLSASSAAVYGDPREVPLRESAPTNPLSPYGRSKLEAEVLLARELTDRDVDFASLRFSNVYGPRQDAEGEGGVVSIFFDVVRRGGRPVIFGDGRQTRDFIYVADVAAAILAALDSRERLSLGVAEPEAEAGRRTRQSASAYNVSTGSETTVKQLTDDIRSITGYQGDFAHEPAREGDIERSALDPKKAHDAFGWTARASLEAGLAATWRWVATSP